VRGVLRHRYVVGLALLAVVAALFGAASFNRHPVAVAQVAVSRSPTRAVVDATVRGCPGPGSGGVTGGGAAVAAAPAGPAATAAAAGQAVVSRLSPGGSTSAGAAVSSVSQPGKLAVTAVPVAPAVPASRGTAQDSAGSAVPTVAGQGGIMISATGLMSQGFAAEQTGAAGTVTARCGAPGTDFWFAGPGQQTAANIQLYLLNVDGQQADVQVTAVTDSGPLPASADTGIVVPPHGLVIQSLAKLLQRSRYAGLHVIVSLGRVVATVRETSAPSKPGGWLPPTQAPARLLVLPGLPGTSGARELYVAVPGASNAQVKVTAVTAKGTYQPTAGGGTDLPGGSAAAIPLPSLGGIPAAVQVTSNVPVVAAMMMPGGADGSPGAFTVATAPVSEQGVIAGLPGAAAGSAELVLSAPQAAATVRIGEATQAAAFGSLPASVLQVPAGHTVVVRLRPPVGVSGPAAFAAVLTPLAGSGALYAGIVLRAGGSVQSILPVISALTSIRLPPVRSSLTAVLP